MLNAFRQSSYMHSPSTAHATKLAVQNPGADARRQLLQAREEIPNLTLLDVADIRHEICNVASRVGHLLLNVVVQQDAVHCPLLASDHDHDPFFTVSTYLVGAHQARSCGCKSHACSWPAQETGLAG
jgi:hypothetical protein